MKKELGGDFEDAVLALMTPSRDYIATELHDAIEGLGTDESTLIEILAGCSNDEIEEISEAYQRCKYKKVLVQNTSTVDSS